MAFQRPIFRKRPSPGVHILHHERTLVFVTVCTADRKRWLACNSAHALLHSVWTNATAWLVGAYVIIPDHIHFFAAPQDTSFTIERWLQYWKSQFSKAHANRYWKWLPLAFHHRLRAEESYSEKFNYMRQNPVRAGLVTNADDWPFRGEIHRLT